MKHAILNGKYAEVTELLNFCEKFAAVFPT
jgi:hypothetical protein